MYVSEDAGYVVEELPPEKRFSEYKYKHGDVFLTVCKCGCSKLEVGQGDFYVVIRCPDCGMEACIADG